MVQLGSRWLIATAKPCSHCIGGSGADGWKSATISAPRGVLLMPPGPQMLLRDRLVGQILAKL
ncbi:hypothetical protein SAMN06265373_105119 [Shimia sagamensis]|uniref:Uncharacterized protein n=1 Tax=Shimia sagamensis TaxID=1566352 RepID=A0ABY1P448_9RHOB|nr:hypothetical protein SAMN06265373_105119 [Shimia sagamensis]